VARVLSLYLEAAGVTRAELFEARRLVEPATAYYAARRGRAAARGLSGRSGSALHAAIAELARSPALELFVHTLLLASGEPGRTGAGTQARERALVRCIAAGRAAQARSDMHAQLLEREGNGPRVRRRTPRALRNGKRAELLVRELSDAIRSSGLEAGTRLGSEPELIRRHGVSRGVLREAVRMLEQHSVVRMRRGIGGGLFVTQPDPASVVLSASVYLAHLELGPRSYHEARLALEPPAAALAAERASEPDLRSLQVALGRALIAGGEDLPPAARSLHERIADLCGNRAVALFARAVITAAWGDERFAPEPPRLPPGWQADLRSSQIRIATAILSRDAQGARAAMQEHLDITTAWWTAVRGREGPS
jgi:DNA-binding FadR family transcriptional regulator